MMSSWYRSRDTSWCSIYPCRDRRGIRVMAIINHRHARDQTMSAVMPGFACIKATGRMRKGRRSGLNHTPIANKSVRSFFMGWIGVEQLWERVGKEGQKSMKISPSCRVSQCSLVAYCRFRSVSYRQALQASGR